MRIPNITNYKPKEFAALLNVTVKTLQRWDRDKILVANRTPTNRRYYTYDQSCSSRVLKKIRIRARLSYMPGYRAGSRRMI